MSISNITNLLIKFNIKIPENYMKEEIVRFATEARTERIVETPEVLRNIPSKNVKILDVGCRYSLLPIQLASLGNEVYGIDIYPYKRRHPNFHFTKLDILKAKFKRSFFDVVISLSTIEHIGLGFFGEKVDLDGDRKAIKKINFLLKRRGILLLTAPFGKPFDSSWYRVYDKKRLLKLLDGFKIREMRIYKKSSNEVWIPVTLKEAETIDSSVFVSSAVFVKAIKK